MATKRKVKRYDEGGVTQEDLDVANESSDPIAELNRRKAWTDEEVSEPMKKMSFKDAFASARKAGDKTFEWNGKKFTTELASEKKTMPERVVAKKEEVSVEKPKLRYQSLQDRARDYEAAREESGVGMYGSTKREKVPVEDRLLKNPAIRKSEQKFMGSLKFSKGGSTASRRGDGIAQRGKTKGRMV